MSVSAGSGAHAGAWRGAGRRIFMAEVGPRDGLQNEDVFVATDDKIALIDALSQTGVATIEVTAFVSAKAIPALRDAEMVMRGIARRGDVAYTALVPNVRGAERALESRADGLNLVMSASESHNRANLHMACEESFRALAAVAALAHDARVPVNVSLSCTFGCPIEGDVPEATVLGWVRRFVDELGAEGVTLCDTTGMAFPSQVAALVARCRALFPEAAFTGHFHDTRGMGLANLLAAADAGIDRFDASIGGIGGCPYAPGATGNVCSEDIVHALALCGFDTGVDLDRLIAAANTLPALIGHDVPSRMRKTGTRLAARSTTT